MSNEMKKKNISGLLQTKIILLQHHQLRQPQILGKEKKIKMKKCKQKADKYKQI